MTIDRLASNQGPQRNQNARRITARRRDQLRIADFLSVNLRQSVDRLLQQIRRGMIAAVKFLVNFCVANPEVRAQVDDARAKIDKRFGKFGAESVRQGQKNNL